MWSAFFSGVSMAAFAASAVFFLKFWKASRDRFFLYFSISCALLALERVVILWADIKAAEAHLPLAQLSEATAYVYLIRLAAFACLSFAIVGKNRPLPPAGD